MARMKASRPHRATGRPLVARIGSDRPEADITRVVFTDPRDLSPDTRPKMPTPERLYWARTGQLAYPAGAEVPVEEHESGDLIGETEMRRTR